MNVVRRIGPNPHRVDENGDPKPTPAAGGCPDILELDTGDIAIIGIRITDKVRGHLPDSASVGADEEMVLLPRQQLIDALGDISRL